MLRARWERPEAERMLQDCAEEGLAGKEFEVAELGAVWYESLEGFSEFQFDQGSGLLSLSLSIRGEAGVKGWSLEILGSVVSSAALLISSTICAVAVVEILSLLQRGTERSCVESFRGWLWS